MTERLMTQPFQASTVRRGFTMAEMVVAVTIMVIVTAVVASLFVQVRKMVALSQWMAETRSQLRTTVQTLGDDLKNTNDQAYFIMLNRDYGWGAQLTPPLAGASSAGAVLYPGNPGAPTDTSDRCIWADRISFVANGPFNTLQNFQVTTGGRTAPVVASSARLYYGHSLWTHELVDMYWTTTAGVGGPVAMTQSLNPFRWQPALSPTAPGPYQMSSWNSRLDQRPAVDWSLVRRAILQISDPAADVLGLGLTRESDWRAVADNEFQLLDSSLIPGLYTVDDLSGQIDAWRRAGAKDWAATVLAPRVDTGWPSVDATIMARARLLLPHAAKIRFQVRLSDGTIVPRTDDSNPDPRVRGGISGYATGGGVTGLNPNYDILGTNPAGCFGLADPSLATESVHNGAGTPTVPVRQLAYLWTKGGTNLAGSALYPVALRVRLEVYDPQKRTPDPIRVDEWLPIRWNKTGP